MFTENQVFKLLALNIDGTLLKSNGRLSRETMDVIQHVQSKNVYVTLVTSRHFQSAKKVAKSLGLDTILITHSGAIIGEELEDPLFERCLSEDQTEQVVRLFERYPCHCRVIAKQFSVGNRKNLQLNEVAKAIMTANDPLFYPVQFVDSVEETVRLNPIETTKIDAYFSNMNAMQLAIKQISREVDGVDCIVSDHGRLEVVAQRVCKKRGLERLGKHLHIHPNEMVYIGDAQSDIPLLHIVGMGIAMGNSSNEVKRQATWVTRTQNEQGVAYAVKEIFRKQFSMPFLEKIKNMK